MTKISVKLNPDCPPTGSDLTICNAARRSFNTRSDWENAEELWCNPMVDFGDDPYRVEMINPNIIPKLKDKDKRLLEFLSRGMAADDFEQFKLEVGGKGLDWLYYMDNNKEQELLDLLWQWRNTPTHDTPFNHTFISFEVKAPIFCRAQLVKHEYLIMSEFSRRYITDNIEFYEPDYWRKAAPNKKQGSLEEAVDWVTCPSNLPAQANESLLGVYEKLIAEGVAPEQARMVLPQSTMTEWTWSGTLGAFAKMCTLRLHPEAQYEARLVAQEVYKYLKKYYPVAAPALVEGVK